MNTKIYEDAGLLALQEGAMRPGGLALTKKAAAFLEKGARILDVGCGVGESVALLNSMGFDAKGIDESETLIGKGKSLQRNVELGDAYALKGRYDALLYECVMSLLNDKEAALEQASGAINEDGVIIVSDLYPRWGMDGEEGASVPCITCANGVLPLEKWIVLMRACGFRLIHFEDETDLYKGFLATLIMEYGSVDAFFAPFTGEALARQATENTGRRKLGYFFSVWSKWK
ncbi:class I SAM-dependent methyltransferase [Christensenellaceae bacterium OttesenSCG-928-M15]|nr:class I SAM-dependent methyltransferase [Christensenellaceae bacterium OttesenSCG-928-M15]